MPDFLQILTTKICPTYRHKSVRVNHPC
jgi:hypothetical protein